MRKFILAAAAALFAAPSLAQTLPPPRLLVVISVDQFSANLFDEFRPQLTGGIARLATGTVFRNGYQSHAATETCPGHSTILTGDHPSRTGIVANTWIDQSIERADKKVYCVEDETQPGTSSVAYKVSPRHLLVPTLGELMKVRWPASRTIAVSGKDRAAVMMSGQRPDQRWYWNGKTFDTDLAGAAIPQTVARAKAAIAAALSRPQPALQPTPYCQGKERQVAVSGGGKPVGIGRLGREAGDLKAFEASPEMDGDTLAIAAGLVDEMRLGRGAAPDLLAIGLSATDHVGHDYGTEGEEMCLQLTELDREIGDFLSLLDSRRINYEVVLTADHGGKDIPERERLTGVSDAARVDPALGASAMGKTIADKLGLKGSGLFAYASVLDGRSFGDIFVDRSLPAADRARLLEAAIAAYRAHPQVEAVFTAGQIAETPVPRTPPETWTLIQRVRASYYPGRSGDFYVVLKKDVTPVADTAHTVATHGSVWNYDRRVPILFWRPGINGTTIEHSAETTDILPTLASLIGLPVMPGSIDGRCLGDVPGTSCPTR